MSTATQERQERKRYVRNRQRIVFTCVISFLAVCLVVSLMFFYHVFGLGLVHTPEQAPNYGQEAPCAVKSNDNNPAVMIDNRSITISVLNGTKFTGFATSVGKALENRGFQLQGVGNFTSANVERTAIYFGANAINEAYTLAANFTDAKLVMDNREDKLISVVLGATFSDLVPIKKVPTAGKPITSIESCKPAAEMKDLPKAFEHTAV